MSAGGFNNTTGADAADDEQQPTMPAARPSEPQLRFGLQFQFGAVALLEALCLLFSISTITSTYYYRWDLTYTVPSRETNTQYYGLYQTCMHSTLYSDHVRNAAKGVCAGVYFAEIFMALAALSNTIAFALYLGTNGTTKLPSGERAWTLLAKAHGLCTLALLLALVAGSAIFHDLKDLLGRNLTPSVQEGKLDLSWGFAFNILAMLSHLLVVLVLVSTSPSASGQNGDGEGDDAADPSAPPAKGGGLKEPLLDV